MMSMTESIFINRDMELAQMRFFSKIIKQYPDNLGLRHLIYSTHLAKEAHEVLDCYPWKFHRGMKEVPREDLIEELVDVYKFWYNLILLHKITPSEFEKAYWKKVVPVRFPPFIRAAF